MKTGDLEPPWRVAISDGGQVADLGVASSWRFVASHRDGTVVFTDETPTITVGDNAYEAVIEHEWSAGETDAAGLLLAEIVAVWPGGREQTFPSIGHATLQINEGLD